MNNNKAKLSILFGACALASVFTGCQDYDAGYTLSQVKQSAVEREYSANFISEYGDLSDVKSWDLSSLGDELNYMDGALTRSSTKDFDTDPNYVFRPLVGDALGNTADIAETTQITTGMFTTQADPDYYYLPQATFDWLTVNMTEDRDHTDGKKRNVSGKVWAPVPGAGKNFKMLKPTADFYLLPIYQGLAVSCYDLHLVVNGKDYLVWKKGQGLEYSKRNYEYLCYFKFTKEDGTDGEYYKKNSVNRRSFLKSMKKVGDTFSDDYTILSDAVTPQGDAYKHTVTYFINGKNGNDGVAKNEIINESETNLSGQIYKFTYAFSRIGELTGGAPTWIKLSEKTEDKSFCTLENYGAWEVRSKPIHFDASKFEGDFFFYLEITKGVWNDEDETATKNNAAIPGTKQRSDKGMMAAMAADVQDDIAAVTGDQNGINALLLGCEAANRAGSDYDYNDVVFLLVSNSPQTILETEERRYLCEDLGSTYDFDFNDIVVDVKQTQNVTSTFTETDTLTHKGTWTRTLSNRTQTATIAHMCGTIPFQVYIGDKDKTKAAFKFDAMINPSLTEQNTTEGYTTDVRKTEDAKYQIKLENIASDAANVWNPATNNIYIDVWQGTHDVTKADDRSSVGGGSTVMFTAKFPTYEPGPLGPDGKPTSASKEGGKIPQMIAVDPTVKWLPEHYHIPAAWVNAARTLDITTYVIPSSSDTE